MNRRRQHGVALITALLVVAVATAAAVAMAARQQIDIRRTGNILQGEQAALYLQAVEDWSGKVLERDRRNSTVDALGDDWARLLPPVPVDNGQLAGHIVDLQARFNLNNLVQMGTVNSAEVERFRRLLANLQLDPELATAVIDWLDGDINYTLPAGAEDDAYLLRTPPYRAANGPMASVTELRLVAGVERDTYRLLEPYVTVLPYQSAINLNTASLPLLLALDDGLDASSMEAFITARGEKGFATVAEALRHEVFAGHAVQEKGLSVSSNWFMVISDLQVGRIYRRAFSVLARADSGLTTTYRRSYAME